MKKEWIKAQFDPAKDSNPFISILIEEDGTVWGGQEFLPLKVDIHFECYETRKALFGLPFACIKGDMKGCNARIVSAPVDNIKVHVTQETIVRTDISKKSSHGVGVKIKNLFGNLGQAKSLSQTKKEKHILENTVTEKTFDEFVQGEKPEWHFKKERGRYFLEKPFSFTIGVMPEKIDSNAKSIFCGETLKYLRITDMDGKPVSLVKEWITKAKIKKEYDTRDIRVGFRLVKKNGTDKF
jgi:hypothetical protein